MRAVFRVLREFIGLACFACAREIMNKRLEDHSTVSNLSKKETTSSPTTRAELK
jgi:hypothetical protein